MDASTVLMFFASRWGSGLAGWSVASLIIWYVFPLVPALRSPTIRISAIVATLVICLLVNGGLSLRNRHRRKKLEGAIAGDVPEGERDPREIAAESAEEVAELRSRLKEALARMRVKKRSRRLYEQPWFVMIGPPGAGKTTALLNSGLHLTFGRDDEPPTVQGVGGTRLCDWWFTDEAVLIDTAGRYTTQDSDADVDKAGWLGFLDLLRKTRPRQPINGVVVVISVVDLVTAAPAERAAHARAVRKRIKEIDDRLGLRVPVYVMLSKADRIRGFDAYFDHLDATGRAQVWGMTFALDKGVAAFATEFRLLLRRLEEHLVERLQGERAGERRAQIGGFPLQVASIEAPVSDFLRQAFSGSRLDPAPFLRGVYVTSATQQGTPIDRLTGMLAGSFGIDQQRVPALRPVSGRSYFVTRLVREVVLGEALLVSRKAGKWERRRILRAAGFATIGVATVLAGLLLWRADADNRVAIEASDEALAAYRQGLSSIPLDPVSSDDLPHVSPLLDAAANLPRGGAGWASRLFFGLSQHEKLDQSDRLAYRHALERIFLPRLIWRLEQQMRADFGNPNLLYQATRVYLMLGDQGPLTPSLVRAWMDADWSTRFPGALNAPLRGRLAVHLDALLDESLPQVPLDGALVEAARATFSRVPLAERIYSRLRDDTSAQQIPDWSPAKALGPDGVRLFVRRSGRSLDEGISGFFSGEGYRQALLGGLPEMTRRAAEESWVLGHAEQVPTEGPQITTLETAVETLYAKELETRWDALLGDLTLTPFKERQKTIRDLYVLSSPQSPMRDLLTAIVQQLKLAPPKPATQQKDGQPAAGEGPAAAPTVAESAVEQHYRALFGLVASDHGAPPLDNILRMVNSLQQELAAASPGGSPVPTTLQNQGDPAELLLAEAERQPLPIADWLRKISKSGSAVLGDALRDQATTAFAAADGPRAACRSVVERHYPFDPKASIDAPIDDFARLFGPGGKLDTYFQSQLKPFVDTRGATWQPHPLGGVAAPIDTATAAVFQRIAAIRDAYFPTGASPQVSFSISPIAGSDPSATLTIGSTAVSKDPNQAASFTWPSGGGLSAASLGVDQGQAAGSPLAALFGGAAPATNDSSPAPAPAALQFSGAWALFRLIGRAKVSRTNDPTTFNVGFDVGGHRAAFRLQAGSEHNPFGRNLLGGFKCPTVE